MSGPSSPSRLSLTLQGYDQVIALSQGNINATLKYNFKVKPALCNFDVVFPERGFGLKGLLGAPTVALIDKEDADQALFYLNFDSGKYFWTEFPKQGGETQLDDDGLPVLPQPKRETLSVAGWSLAFEVDFSVKKASTVPDEILKQINDPGIYSVSQLMIDFGTADILNFSWEHSTTSDMPKGKEAGIRADIERSITHYRNDVLLQKGGSHNILCYTVKADDPGIKKREEVLKAVTQDAPSFPPTSIRLQTINYRPQGDAAQVSVNHHHNAFLLTEMTQFREMPRKDLQWSGDWFYDSIGGTMVMSRDIFLEKFLLDKVKPINEANLSLANSMVNSYMRNEPWEDWCFEGAQPKVEQLNFVSVDNSLKKIYKCALSRTVSGEVQKAGFFRTTETWRIDYTADITTTVVPKVGEGKVSVESVVIIKTIRSGNVLSISTTWTAVMDLRAAVKGAGLDVTVNTSGGPNVQVDFTGANPRGLDMEAEKRGLRDFWSRILNSLSWDEIAQKIQKPLNGQGRFVFPGGGTFEMKDVIFNNSGDLLIGLTFIERRL